MLTVLIFSGCGPKNGYLPNPVSRTMIIYLEMDHNLSWAGTDNINDIISSISRQNLNGGRIVAYIKTNDESCIAELTYDKNNKGYKKVIREVPRETNMSDWKVLRDFIVEAKRIAPANEYGLILSSHALGWLPATRPVGKMYSFGYDNGGYQMDVTDLAEALKGTMFDYIIFDACFMGLIEVLYELKDVAKYVVAAPTEMIAQGMPYDVVTPMLFLKRPDLVELCRQYMKRYPDHGVIALYSLEEIQPVAQEVRLIVSLLGADNIKRKEYSALSSSVQCYDRQLQDIPKRVFFDMVDLCNYMGANTDLLKKRLEAMVLYKNYTGYWVPIDGNKFSGVGMSVPLNAYLTSWQDYYLQMKWGEFTYNQ